MKYAEIAKTNVNEHVEKKNGLSYLSWAWAVDQLLRLDSSATWDYREPVKWGETVMVFCSVTALGNTRTAQLPVMDHRNKAIPNPDAFQVNTAMQRCLAKAIALHGLGLYIYAGEDLPETDEAPQKPPQKAQTASPISITEILKLVDAATTAATLDEIWNAHSAHLDEAQKRTFLAAGNKRKKEIFAAPVKDAFPGAEVVE